MYSVLQSAFTLALVALAPLASAVDKTRDPDLVAQLKTAATQLDRDALLPNDSDWLYDFTVSSDILIPPWLSVADTC